MQEREKHKPWQIGDAHQENMNGIFEAIGIVHSACTGVADRDAAIDEVAYWLLWRVRDVDLQVVSLPGGWVKTRDESEAMIRQLARHTLLRYWYATPLSQTKEFLLSFI